MSEVRLSLLEENNFWIYYLYITAGLNDTDSFRLTDSNDKPLVKPDNIKLDFNLLVGSGRCTLNIGSGTINTRVVEFRSLA